MSTKRVTVIGAGPAGYVCAIRLAQLGQEVTVVEREKLGGTCLNVGCIPSKALIAAGCLVEKIGKASAMGITTDGVSVDVEQLVSWKAAIVTRLTGGIGTLLKKNGVQVVYGAAKFKSATTVEVTSESGTELVEADEVVIATGSTPIELPGFSFDEDDVWSSTGALAPDRVPGHIVVIGGGYIGLELGCMYRKLGAEVTVLEATGGALPGQDADCVKVIERSLKKSKIKLMTETFAKGFERDGDTLKVQIERGGALEVVECDQIISTVGRRPHTESLGLEAIGLTTDEGGFLTINSRMQTKVPHVYAIGDVAGQPMLAHKGSKEGLVAAAVIAGQAEEYDAKCVPAVIFTSPEMASVGLSEAEAEARGLAVRTGSFPFAASGRAMSLMETDGFVKIVADAETDELLGVHMVGPEVTELIAEAALAIELGATAEDIGRTIHAHPTLPEAMMEAAEAVHGAAVHIFQAK